MKVSKIQFNNQTSFKAKLPKKQINPTSGAVHDYWDGFVQMCKEDGKLERLNKVLNDMQNVEKDKIIALDIIDWFTWTPPSTTKRLTHTINIGLFESQESLDNARKKAFDWPHIAEKAIHIDEETPACSYYHEKGKTDVHLAPKFANRKYSSNLILDSIEMLLDSCKDSSPIKNLIDNLRLK